MSYVKREPEIAMKSPKNRRNSEFVKKLGLKAGQYAHLYDAIGTQVSDPAVHMNFQNAVRKAGVYKEALAALHSTNLENKNLMMAGALGEWIGIDATEALRFLGEIGDGGLTSRVIEGNYKKIDRYDREAARQWASQIQDPDTRNRILQELDN